MKLRDIVVAKVSLALASAAEKVSRFESPLSRYEFNAINLVRPDSLQRQIAQTVREREFAKVAARCRRDFSSLLPPLLAWRERHAWNDDVSPWQQIKTRKK